MKKTKSHVIPVRFSHQVFERLKKNARRRELPVSTFIRMIVVTKLVNMR